MAFARFLEELGKGSELLYLTTQVRTYACTRPNPYACTPHQHDAT